MYSNLIELRYFLEAIKKHILNLYITKLVIFTTTRIHSTLPQEVEIVLDLYHHFYLCCDGGESWFVSREFHNHIIHFLVRK